MKRPFNGLRTPTTRNTWPQVRMNLEMRMNLLLTTASAMVLAGASPFAAAQALEYPVKPVTMVVGFPPGGSSDFLARATAAGLSKVLGVRVLVDNRPGANSAIATQRVAREPADGYTLLYNATNMAYNLVGMKQPGYKWSDFESLGGVAYSPYAMFVNTASSKTKTLKEFVEFGKSHPDKLTFASLGAGSTPGLVAERFKEVSGIGYREIPYKGGAQAMADVVGGTMDVYFTLPYAASSMVNYPNIAVMAVTGNKRSRELPNVPTFAELGYPQMTDVLYGGVWVAASTPKPILDKLRKALTEALKDPSVVAAMKQADQMPYEGDYRQFDSDMRNVEAIARNDYRKFKLEPQ
jgi:tripartite-type tricarboxylate transporter receptor subunit TctC